MDRIGQHLKTSFALGFVAVWLISTPASAISVELAKACRQMALKTYPPKLPGSKAGNAKAGRNYYNDCIAKKAIMPGSETPK
jgi:hypothetical protein